MDTPTMDRGILLEPLLTFASTGEIRRYRIGTRQERSCSRCLPSSKLQEHSRDGSKEFAIQ